MLALIAPLFLPTLAHGAAYDPFKSQRSTWNLVEQGGLCNACYQFSPSDSPLMITSTNALGNCASNASQVQLTNYPYPVSLIVDPRLTAAASPNPYHILATVIRIAMIAHEYRENGVATHFVIPPKWKTQPWISTVVEPALQRIGVETKVQATGKEFCLQGWSIPAVQVQPFNVEYVYLMRSIIETECRMSLLSGPAKNDKEVLLLSSHAAQQSSVRPDNLHEIAASLDKFQISYDLAWPSDQPCEQARLYSKRYRLIVTPMGPHLAGLVAMSPGTSVLQVDPGRPKFSFCRLKRALGNRWVHFVANNDGSERFVFPNCTAHNDSSVVPNCGRDLGPKARLGCMRRFWSEPDVTLSRRDKITIIEMIRIMLNGIRW